MCLCVWWRVCFSFTLILFGHLNAWNVTCHTIFDRTDSLKDVCVRELLTSGSVCVRTCVLYRTAVKHTHTDVSNSLSLTHLKSMRILLRAWMKPLRKPGGLSLSLSLSRHYGNQPSRRRVLKSRCVFMLSRLFLISPVRCILSLALVFLYARTHHYDSFKNTFTDLKSIPSCSLSANRDVFQWVQKNKVHINCSHWTQLNLF